MAETVWVALLRAVNVGGRNRIAMAELRDLMADLGFGDTVTHLQSGNVLFAAPSAAGADALGAQISGGITDRFGHELHVIMRTADQLASIVANVPWEEPANSSSGVVFMSEPMDGELDMDRFAPDQGVVIGADVHVDCPTGFAKTKLTVAWIEKETGLAGTRRNWNTVKVLAEKSAAFAT